jgi:hypothetical protein
VRLLGGADEFCDLNCYNCDAFVFPTCLLFGGKNSMRSIIITQLARGVFLYDERSIEGLWRRFPAVASFDLGVRFPVYAGEPQQ